MKYIVGLIIGIALMVTWPQQTRQVFDHTLEYIEFGIAQVRQHIQYPDNTLEIYRAD